MDTKNIYTALTIGPILKTLQSVKSTKAIWSASYMFSYLIKEIIKKLNGKTEFILPYYKEVEINGNVRKPLEDPFQAGLFPDRIILKNKVGLQNIIDKTLEEYAEKVIEDITDKDKIDLKEHTDLKAVSAENLIKYLKNYLNYYHLSIDLGEKENVIIEVNKLLDSLELQQRVMINANENYLKYFFEDVYYNRFIENEFKEEEKRFPSTIEIANSEFKNIDKNKFRQLVNILFKDDSIDRQKEFIAAIKKEKQFEPLVRNYQKYIAVVQADGDNIGGFIKQLYALPEKREEHIESFSKNLLSFAIEAVELIKSYNGTPVYAGGDDLLYFMPVAQTTVEGDKVRIEKTVFSLIGEIDELFKKYFIEYNDEKEKINFKQIIENVEKKPTMSYGVSISYYKFPLNEALEEGVNQLFNTAKKTDKKNAVSYTILKHSGQFFGATFHKKDDSYKIFNALIKEDLAGDNFIHSIVYKLEPQKAVLFAIGCETDEAKRNTMFDNFFWNNFNESIHREKNDREKLIPFLERTKQLFKDVYRENDLNKSKKGVNKQNDENILKIYSALRFIDFIHNKEERDE